MSIKLGDTAPDFKAESTIGNLISMIFLEILGNLIFPSCRLYTGMYYRAGFTAKLKSEFEQRNTKAIALSVDGVEDHHNWIKDINETQNTEVEFPIIADKDRKFQNCMILFIRMLRQQLQFVLY
jgi:alkyl hydroperoxide reductase subunit AhpC